jgi:hypothetical protein
MPRSRIDQNSSRPSSREKPFQPAIGREFGVQEVEAKTRGYLARLLASSAVIGVLVTGGYGLITGNYTAVIAAWSVAGPIIGALVTHYFGPQRNTG